MTPRNRRSAALMLFVLSLALLGTPAAASESSTQNHLFAFVVPTNRGPLPPCSADGSGCTAANRVWHFIHVVNANQLTNFLAGGTTRATLPNAFTVSSVDQTIFVDGVETFSGFTFTPPPEPSLRLWSGHWPSTVTCPSAGTPCNMVGSPAVVPGENAVVLYSGWTHGVGEPNGTYVFRLTVHGTMNGTPVDLTASSPPILMTD